MISFGMHLYFLPLPDTAEVTAAAEDTQTQQTVMAATAVNKQLFPRIGCSSSTSPPHSLLLSVLLLLTYHFRLAFIHT